MEKGWLPVEPAQRTRDIRYAVRDVLLVAEEAKKAGKDMVYLNIGDPLAFDFSTPLHMIESIERAMRAGHNGYSPSSGIPEAMEAIRGEADRKGIRAVNDVFVTYGASEAIEIALSSLVNRGENILVPNPGYPLYTAVLSKLEAIENPYLLDEENGWQPSLSDIEARIDDKTRAIVLINPNNPTGVLYGRDILEGILELARKHRLIVFSDEIYDKLVFDDLEHVSIGALADDVPILTFNGLSKSYLAPGFRIGWGIISGRAGELQNYVNAMLQLTRARLCASHPLQYAIKPALEGPQDHLPAVRSKLMERRDITFERLNAIEGVSCVRPTGAFYAFPRLEINEPDEEWVKGLIRATGVVPVHGDGFGQKPGTAHMRIVFLPQPELLETAYSRISDYVQAHRNNPAATI